jgi:hypothetical protein
MKPLIIIFCVCIALQLTGQTTATFESFNLEAGQALNGSTLPAEANGFEDGNLLLPNDYNPMFNSWLGWAISATTDVTTPGFMNDLSAITGGGVEGSTTYAISYAPAESKINFTGDAIGAQVEGVYITNSTYAYLSMRDGDGFAKKFGGETGNDPDYFLLQIQAYLDGQLQDNSIAFYLADYRFEDNSQDYIVDEWTYVDLTVLGDADSLRFSLISTDIGSYGMNTPAYFCIDNLTITNTSTAVEDPTAMSTIRVYPNPVQDRLSVEMPEGIVTDWIIQSIDGRVWERGNTTAGVNEIDVSGLVPGLYFLKFSVGGATTTQKLIKL